ATDSTPSARWRDAARGRFTMSHLTSTAIPASLPAPENSPTSMRCETRVGAATATIVAFGDGASTYVVHARIRWPDGELLDVHADAADREHLEQLLAAVRTIRRTGAGIRRSGGANRLVERRPDLRSRSATRRWKANGLGRRKP